MALIWQQSEHLVQRDIGGHPMFTVDNHQFALLQWAQAALEIGQPFVLVSIDYHPDTNPPFWLQAYQKAMAINPEREEALVECFTQRVFDRINPKDISTLEAQMPLMRNDEHINTAITLGYLKDYHMINCMERHEYAQGHHYLVNEAHFGSLKDDMFAACGFDISCLKDSEGSYLKYILDIDLDYFMRLDDLNVIPREMTVMAELVQHAQLITSARSTAYFDYLKQVDFDINVCEKALVELLKRLCETEIPAQKAF